MNYSIERRMPFMDHRLVEFNASVPGNYKIHNGWTKYYARVAFNNKLPKQIVWRKDKMGWPTPSQKKLDISLNRKLIKIMRASKILKLIPQKYKQHLKIKKKLFIISILEKYNLRKKLK